VVEIEEQLGSKHWASGRIMGVRTDWAAGQNSGELSCNFSEGNVNDLLSAPPPCLSSVPCPLFSSLFSQPIPFYSQVKDNEIRRPSGKGFSMVGKQDGDGLMAALPMWTAGD
jgi:hypothetical protein